MMNDFVKLRLVEWVENFWFVKMIDERKFICIYFESF